MTEKKNPRFHAELQSWHTDIIAIGIGRADITLGKSLLLFRQFYVRQPFIMLPNVCKSGIRRFSLHGYILTRNKRQINLMHHTLNSLDAATLSQFSRPHNHQKAAYHKLKQQIEPTRYSKLQLHLIHRFVRS